MIRWLQNTVFNPTALEIFLLLLLLCLLLLLLLLLTASVV
jgi:hypothetical protein